MLTFENVLEIFQEYLLRDPEEEVLPCKRGYVRLTWDKDSRYCVDGILCRTPEELFDILLSDFQDFQPQFQNKQHRSHFSASFRQSRYGWHSSSTAFSSASVTSRRPRVRQIMAKS